jgi:hypothetical protein
MSANGFVDHVVPIGALSRGEVQALAPDVVLSRGSAFAGRVIDALGHGVGGATVAARKLETRDRRERLGRQLDPWTETDAAGHFRFAGFAPGDYLLSAGYRGRHASRQAKLEGGEDMEVTLQLAELGRGATWSATVEDADGHPVPQATVFYGRTRTVTDTEGRFTCYDLPGKGSLTIEHDRFLVREITWSAAGELPAGVRLDRGATLELHVRVRGGAQPLPAWLNTNLRGQRRGQAAGVHVDRGGIARLHALEPGERTVFVWSPDFPLPPAAVITLRGEETAVLELELDSGKEPVEIVVMDAARRPIEAASVRFDWSGESAPGTRQADRYLDTVRTDRTGRARSALALSAGVAMTVEAEGFPPRRLEECRRLVTSGNEIQVLLAP